MGPAFYIMAILGCGEADTACEQVAVAQSRYESVEACNAATEGALGEHTDLAFPVVVAQCKPAGSKLSASISADQIDLPEPGREPAIKRAAYAPQQLAKLEAR
jgi:hypothetical protein